MTKTDFSKYPDAEVRLPRQHYTAHLHKICTRLDAAHAEPVSYTSELYGANLSATLVPQSLWVVGSYARGASHCGDLDLVLDIRTVQGYCVDERFVKKHITGAIPRVRAYRGTPQDNLSGAKFEEAVLIWQPGMNWSEALANLKVIEGVGRYERSRDQVPLRNEQIQSDWEEMEGLLQARKDGKLKWKFVPLSAITPVLEGANEEEQVFFKKCMTRSKRLQQVAPLIVGYARTLRDSGESLGTLTLPWDGPAQMGGTQFHFSDQGWLSPRVMDQKDATRWVYMPPLNTRGPNGFWVVERGPEHALTKPFEGARFWSIVHAKGFPMVEHRSFAGQDHFSEAWTVLSLYAIQEDALEELSWFNEQEDSGEPVPPEDMSHIREFRSAELLELIVSSDCDVIEIGKVLLPVTPKGGTIPECADQYRKARLPLRALGAELARLSANESQATDELATV